MSADHVQLEFKERLNYPEYLQHVIENINSALNSEKVSMMKVNTMIMNLLNDIPNTWYDNEFEKDIENVTKEREVPNVIEFCGVPLSKKYMDKHDIPLTKKIPDVNFFRLKNAIINLLDRRNMLVRKDKIEMSTGRNLEFETLDDLIDEMAKEEDEENV